MNVRRYFSGIDNYRTQWEHPSGRPGAAEGQKPPNDAVIVGGAENSNSYVVSWTTREELEAKYGTGIVEAVEETAKVVQRGRMSSKDFMDVVLAHRGQKAERRWVSQHLYGTYETWLWPGDPHGHTSREAALAARREEQYRLNTAFGVSEESARLAANRWYDSQLAN